MTADVEQILETGSLSEIAALLRTSRISAVEIAQWFRARIEAESCGRALNAVREISPLAFDHARIADQELRSGLDRGPLHGIPVLLKDNILVPGLTATAGAAALTGFRPQQEATLAARLRRAGAVILGKTNMTEFADFVSDIMPSEFSGAGGVVRNPHGPAYGRGQGSSVGSASAVAAGLAPYAIGSETQNSIQSPACHSSVVGLKPSVGAVSRAGLVPLVPSQDSPGPIARTVADARLVLSVIQGPDVRDTATLGHLPPGRAACANLAGIRLGVPRRMFVNRPELSAALPAFERCLSRLSRAGAHIVDPCDLPSSEQLIDVRSTVFRSEFKAALNHFLADIGSPNGIDSLAALIAWNEAHPDAVPYGQSLLIDTEAAAGLDSDEYRADRARDVALSRTAGIDAAVAMAGADALIAPMGAMAKASGKAGSPVVALPAGLDDAGGPFGVTLHAPHGHDDRLIAVAAAVERVVGERIVPKI